MRLHIDAHELVGPRFKALRRINGRLVVAREPRPALTRPALPPEPPSKAGEDPSAVALTTPVGLSPPSAWDERKPSPLAPAAPPSWEMHGRVETHDATPAPPVLTIIAAVARHFEVTSSMVRSADRTKNITLQRHVAMFLAKKLTNRSLSEIGRLFGNRDHTTVLHGIRRIDLLRGEDQQVADALTAISVSLGVDPSTLQGPISGADEVAPSPREKPSNDGGEAMDQYRPIDISSFASVARPTDVGPVPDQRWLPIERLVVDPSYQRDIQNRGRANVRRIVENFSWCKFSTVVVAPVEGGRYAIIDGQHRTHAAALVGFKEVPCQVIIADRRAQAEAFAIINSSTTVVTGGVLFTARLAAGEPAATAVQDACSDAGVTIVRSSPGIQFLKTGQTLAAGALQAIHTRFGDDVLRATLKFVMCSSAGAPKTLRAVILTGVAEILHDHPEWRDAGDILLAAAKRIDLAAAFANATAAAQSQPGLSAKTLLQATLVEHLEKSLR